MIYIYTTPKKLHSLYNTDHRLVKNYTNLGFTAHVCMEKREVPHSSKKKLLFMYCFIDVKKMKKAECISSTEQ